MTQYRGNDQIRLNSESADRSLTGVAAASCHLNQTTNTLSNSTNVSSTTDSGTGDFLFSFTASFANATYGFTGGASRPSSNSPAIIGPGQIASPQLSASVRTATVTAANVVYDSAEVGVAVFGDLA